MDKFDYRQKGCYSHCSGENVEVMHISHWKCFPKLLHLRCVCNEGREETSPFVILPIPLEPTRVLESMYTNTASTKHNQACVCAQFKLFTGIQCVAQHACFSRVYQ